MVGLLLRSLCSSTRRSLSSSSSSSPFKSSLLLLQRISGLNRHFSAAAAAAPASSAAAAGTSFDPTRLRNVAVIAHGDHVKTTLMDSLLRQCGADIIIPHERAPLDNNISLERERGVGGGSINIPSKVTSIPWGEHELHMVEIPGNSDFEAERVAASMAVQGALLVVDADEGPVAQTEWVLHKALKYGLRPLVLLNKVDRPSVSEERCDEVKNSVLELFVKLGAKGVQKNFPVLYASSKEGWASSTFTKSPPENSKNMADLLDAIVKHVPSPPPAKNLEAPFQMLVTSLPCGEHELRSDDFGDERVNHFHVSGRSFLIPLFRKTWSGRIEVQRAEFERWMSEHGRHYKDTDEWNFRFGVYLSNLRYNSFMNAKNFGFTLGPNCFADMTDEEFMTNYVGFNGLPGLGGYGLPGLGYVWIASKKSHFCFSKAKKPKVSLDT